VWRSEVRVSIKGVLAGLVLACLPLMLDAQGARVAFGSTEQDRSQPVEVTSDSLNVNQNDNTAVFEGDVVIAQGAMRLAAPRVRGGLSRRSKAGSGGSRRRAA